MFHQISCYSKQITPPCHARYLTSVRPLLFLHKFLAERRPDRKETLQHPEKERQINQLPSNTEGPLKSKRLISLAAFSSPSSPSFLSRFLTLQLERLTVRGSQRHSSRHTSDLSFNWLFHSPSPPLLSLAGQRRPLQGPTEETRSHTHTHTHNDTEVVRLN